MLEKLKLTVVLPVEPAEVYSAWLDSKSHSAMTGSEAKIESKIGGKFTAWDEYIEGTTAEMEQDRRIVQRWRTTEFPTGSSDSIVEIIFEAVVKGTKLTLIHTEIPEGQGDTYKQGWKDYYFTPMKSYFKNSETA
ncbi:MAG: SRPBCC domain-containing protein [Candidatus Thorarchaeota archaeon]